MTFADLVHDQALVVPAGGATLDAVLRELTGGIASRVGLGSEESQKLARDLAFGSRGEIVRVNESVVLVLGRVEEAPEVVAAVGVGRAPFEMSGEGTDPRGRARAVILLLTPRSLGTLREEFVPTLVRILRDEQRTARLLAARTPADIRAIRGLMDAELRERLLVQDVLTPMRYRVYPDTPLAEVVDLMIRRQLHAVPVVGENLEVLGIISVGDALDHLLPTRRQTEGAEGADGVERPTATAREVMTRTVMCVSEDQSLLEAANLMVNRNVDQLPVVREGEFIGFLTRYAILSQLFGH